MSKQGSNSELFAHENDALTARPQLHTFLCENNILYEKQFAFQKAHSTDHAIIQLVNEINKSFEENKFTLGVFIDLSKAFDTVNHKILITKLKN